MKNTEICFSIGSGMKYSIDKELKSLSIYSGSLVGRLYPMINIGYRLNKCRSDKYVSVRRLSTPGYNGETIPSLIIEPKECGKDLPCIVFFHGGGLLMSASEAHYQVAKRYAREANCKVIMPDYRLLPKFPYPVALEDCYNTYLWVLQNFESLGINKDRIVFAGDSAGGHIAAALIVMLKDRNQPIPRGAMLIYPALDKRMVTESMKYTDTPIFDSKCYKLFWSMYLKDQNADEAKYASVAELDHLEFFPDTYVEVAEFDCLHDEGIAFAEKLISSGVSAEYHSVDGTFHGFEAASKSSILDRCIKRRIHWIKRVLRTENVLG